MSTTSPIKNKKELETFKNYYLEKKNPRNYLLIIVGLNTALRISDILNLQWKDVYHHNKNCFRKHIDLYEQKTGKATSIAINDAVKTALLQLLKEEYANQPFPSPETYIFRSTRNKDMPLSRYQAYRIIKEAAENTGLDEHISCHSLRKTFGYFAWKQGVEPAMLMHIYNHSSYQITRRYLCIKQEDKDEVFLKINL